MRAQFKTLLHRMGSYLAIFVRISHHIAKGFNVKTNPKIILYWLIGLTVYTQAILWLLNELKQAL
jgi:hypothetical protein